MLGPVRVDPQGAQRPGFTREDLYIDWQARTLTCPHGITSPPWKPTLGDGHPRLTQVRKDQKTSNWERRYAIRAGCEATVSETVHAHGLRHCRYRGLAKTHVQHVLTAAGTNIIRLSEHFPPGTTPAPPPRPASQLPTTLPKAPNLEITNSIHCRIQRACRAPTRTGSRTGRRSPGCRSGTREKRVTSDGTRSRRPGGVRPGPVRRRGEGRLLPRGSACRWPLETAGGRAVATALAPHGR
ncbi:transposase [Streptomyces sp. NPDC051172]|uniref:transposase n=1 Tax=Streptomyces sp. NPDC051172 TaxID=3155796 RepID=UPI00343E4478